MYRLDLKLRLHNGSDIALGPGKAELLEAIAQHGSISAAARALAGGKHGGGTQLTEMGEQVLQRYRALCVQALAAVQGGCAELAEPAAEG